MYPTPSPPSPLLAKRPQKPDVPDHQGSSQVQGPHVKPLAPVIPSAKFLPPTEISPSLPLSSALLHNGANDELVLSLVLIFVLDGHVDNGGIEEKSPASSMRLHPTKKEDVPGSFLVVVRERRVSSSIYDEGKMWWPCRPPGSLVGFFAISPGRSFVDVASNQVVASRVAADVSATNPPLPARFANPFLTEYAVLVDVSDIRLDLVAVCFDEGRLLVDDDSLLELLVLKINRGLLM
ncbi:hypothetical protein M413DRAFT_25870 [Hebeloma cylindrosporum]|uniref:Uncharacterized protein n=1 Tax=Hebeloma cylindrosporum TaxID=76867 RepID=A0A0C3CH76_HEBCY|nr:hypothetical protein M413DRAFT_25870 [Hebeloma cylindrosporum h7]